MEPEPDQEKIRNLIINHDVECELRSRYEGGVLAFGSCIELGLNADNALDIIDSIA